MRRQSPQSQVALVAALVVALVGGGLVVVLVVGLAEGVRGIGPLLLAAVAIGVFALATRLFLVARSLRALPPAARRSPPREPDPGHEPNRPRPRSRPSPGSGVS